MKVTLKDGSVKEYAQPMAVIDIAKDISEGLARMACVAEINGEEAALRTVVDSDCQLHILPAAGALRASQSRGHRSYEGEGRAL